MKTVDEKSTTKKKTIEPFDEYQNNTHTHTDIALNSNEKKTKKKNSTIQAKPFRAKRRTFRTMPLPGEQFHTSRSRWRPIRDSRELAREM